MAPARSSHGFRLLAPLAVAVLALAACSGPEPTPPTPTATATAVQQAVALPAASELVVGENRFPFGLLTVDGQPIEDAQVHARFYLLRNDGQDELRQEADAVYRRVTGVTPHTHAGGEVHEHEEAQGLYVVDRVRFDEAGVWQARLELSGPDASVPPTASLAFLVQERSVTVAVGERVPASSNPTARDVADLSEITTLHPPVPGLYQFTVAEALRRGKPLLVVFSTPAFCTSRMCGPVTDAVVQLYGRYGDRVSFIHIEPWELDTARNEGRLVLTGIAKDWGLPTEPWVFVTDATGTVAARFEGLVGNEELSTALESVLQ